MAVGPTLKQSNRFRNSAFLIVLLVLLTLFLLSRFAPQVGNLFRTNYPKLEVKETPVDPTRLPEGFPREIPLETGSVVVQNYNATTTGSSNTVTTQSTRAFESKKSVEKNFQLYQDFFLKNDWLINTTNEGQGYKSLSAQKSGVTVRVHISQNSITNIVTVNITASPVAATAR
jgi:hypothetical protein